MDIIKRYVYAVTKKLPEKQRADVSRELTSDIEAMVGDKAKGKNPTKEHIYAVLSELGDPDIFAGQYQERRNYIIGPRYFPAYIMLLKTLLMIVPPIISVIILVSEIARDASTISLIINALGGGITVGIHIFFWITVIFAISERSNIELGGGTIGGGEKPKQLWTPDDLPPLPKENAIPKSQTLNGIVWSLVGVIAVLWQVPFIHEKIAPQVPLFFSAEMWPYWTLSLLAITVLSLVVEVYRFIKGAWSRSVVWVLTITNIIVIGYFIGLLFVINPIINSYYIQEVVEVTGKKEMELVFTTATTLAIVSFIAMALYEIALGWYKYTRTRKGEV